MMNPVTGTSGGDEYRIVVEGHLDAQWSEWFEGLALARDEDGETVLTVSLPDQSALLGLLNRLHSLNLKLVSVQHKSGAGK